MPDDFYVIRVTATPNDKQIDELSAFSRELPEVELPGVLYGQTSISVITNLIQTQSRVTLQRSFAVPTDDMAMGPAIRNRTAAVGIRPLREIHQLRLLRGQSDAAKYSHQTHSDSREMRGRRS